MKRPPVSEKDNKNLVDMQQTTKFNLLGAESKNRCNNF